MSRYWCLRANNGLEYEHVEDATRIVSALHMIFRPSQIIASTLLNNQVLDVALYLRTQACRNHGKDSYVDMLLETTEDVTSTNFAAHIAVQQHINPCDTRTRLELNSMLYTQLTASEYKRLQDVYSAYRRSHNGILTV